MKWVIVSDGSTDRTDEIANDFAARHSFISLVRRETKSSEVSFGSKAMAFRLGHEQMRDVEYDCIGNLDADVTFAPTYYDEMLQRFRADANLGVAAGGISELVDGVFVPQKGSLNSAAGSVQLFRRQCYESFGGYIPIKTGGIDAAAEILARMKGWTVQTFPELEVLHHRRMVTGGRTVLRTRFRGGATNRTLGYHPLFQLAVCLRRSFERPYAIGSACAFMGYLYSWAKGSDFVLPDEAVRFLRREQLARLRCLPSGHAGAIEA
jgi:glycosyltransferase involved in cell wall biosynthesis